MMDLFIKIYLLNFFWKNGFGEWKREIWEKELDQNYCCDGRECGCQGASVREMYCQNL